MHTLRLCNIAIFFKLYTCATHPTRKFKKKIVSTLNVPALVNRPVSDWMTFVFMLHCYRQKCSVLFCAAKCTEAKVKGHVVKGLTSILTANREARVNNLSLCLFASVHVRFIAHLLVTSCG